jgi:hypothetical protein
MMQFGDTCEEDARDAQPPLPPLSTRSSNSSSEVTTMSLMSNLSSSLMMLEKTTAVPAEVGAARFAFDPFAVLFEEVEEEEAFPVPSAPLSSSLPLGRLPLAVMAAELSTSVRGEAARGIKGMAKAWDHVPSPSLTLRVSVALRSQAQSRARISKGEGQLWLLFMQ